MQHQRPTVYPGGGVIEPEPPEGLELSGTDGTGTVALSLELFSGRVVMDRLTNSGTIDTATIAMHRVVTFRTVAGTNDLFVAADVFVSTDDISGITTIPGVTVDGMSRFRLHSGSSLGTVTTARTSRPG